MLDSFNGQKFAFLNPVHEFLRARVFIQNLLNFLVKESVFGLFDNVFEALPIFDLS